jgi:hypothetical protein
VARVVSPRKAIGANRSEGKRSGGIPIDCRSSATGSDSFCLICVAIFLGFGCWQEQRSRRTKPSVAWAGIRLLQLAHTSIENCDLGE